MLRVIFDTNIYGLLAAEPKFADIKDKILKDTLCIIYGYSLVRKELRDIPKQQRLWNANKRNLILSLYDELTHGRYLKDSLRLHRIARQFYDAYRQFGGIGSWSETNIGIDFTIVACASLYKLDVVISDDSKTLLSKEALKAYKHISIKEGIWHPNFWKYSDLKMRYGF